MALIVDLFLKNSPRREKNYLPSKSISSRERSTISELLREWGILDEDLELSRLAAEDIESRLEKLSPESEADKRRLC